jgi:hypothetical protein
MSIILTTFGKTVSLIAQPSALTLTGSGIDWTRPESWPADAVERSAGQRTAYEVASLLEMGLAERHGNEADIGYDNFAAAEKEEFQITTAFTIPSPFLLHIDRASDIGRPDFRYKYEFLLGGNVTPLRRVGYYLHRESTDEVFHLDANHFALIEAMDIFNALPPAEKTPQTSWLTFADVKRLSKEVNATLDATLRANDVIVPSSIGLDPYEDSSGALSFMPTCPELDNKAFRTVFDRNEKAEGFYSLDQPGLGRVRIVLSERQRTVLERMKRVRGVTGEIKERLKRDPGAVFDGVVGDVELPYSDRVTGIGEFEFAPIPKPISDLPSMSGLWAGTLGHDEPPTDKTDDTTDKESPSKQTLLIDTHEDDVRDAYREESEKARQVPEAKAFAAPAALRKEFPLKDHQAVGVHWLQTCVRIPTRRGVLLADDMGVGKTLQILTFLAWCIESDQFPELSCSTPPFRPILIVAPLILLETETWENEMKRYFAQDGNVFWPVLSLYGSNLRSFRRKDSSGAESVLARPVLDLDRIRKHRLVITNYEALRDYEFSFAYYPDGKPLWSIVVSDEAQEFKTPNSKISHAVKKLQPNFRIACTGTPVENRLLDLWNIFDALQPGLLGSAREFVSRFERNGHDDNPMLGELKQRLLYQQRHAFLLRRHKSEVLDLPAKTEHKLRCAMSAKEVASHLKLVANLSEAGQKKKKLDLLHQFTRLYQHPLLLNSNGDEFSVQELKASSSKLRTVLDVLHSIRGKNEKVILFARHKDVQRMLARVLAEEFQMPVRILNGDTPRAGGTRKSTAEGRSQILEKFAKGSGFDLLVLSPFVAGVGLTMVEANHVVHYGRWWNPAVEGQATDRVYRLGQNKGVHIYLPILEDRSGQISQTFDQLLDELMERKKNVAEEALRSDEFLTPRESEDEAGLRMFSSLADSVQAGPNQVKLA